MFNSHKIIKKLSLIAAGVGLATAGITAVTNTTSITVQAKTRIILAKKPSQIRHYIKLANRKGTHYFKHPVGMVDFEADNALEHFHMNGKFDDNTATESNIGTTIIGTKTIDNKHYFIEKWHTLVLAKAYNPARGYKVKHAFDVYSLPETAMTPIDKAEAHGQQVETIYKGAKVMICSPKTKFGRVVHNGVAYRGVILEDGPYLMMKEKDMKKLVPYTGHICGQTYFKNGTMTNSGVY